MLKKRTKKLGCARSSQILAKHFVPFSTALGIKELSLNSNIPNSIIGAVSSVLAAHYYSHSKLDALFMESGAPGEIPEVNCEKKCSSWL